MNCNVLGTPKILIHFDLILLAVNDFPFLPTASGFVQEFLSSQILCFPFEERKNQIREQEDKGILSFSLGRKRCVFAIMITLSYEFFALRTLHRHSRDQITVAFSFSKYHHAGPLMFTDREQERHT